MLSGEYNYNHTIVSSKCYFLGVDNKYKRGLKGIPYEVQVNKNDFLNSLYNDNDGKCSFNSLRYNKEYKGVVFQKSTKRTLNSLYVKYFVDDNRVTCHPYNHSA